MARYDGGYDRGYARRSLGVSGSGGYGREYAPRSAYDRSFEWSRRVGAAGMWGGGVGTYRPWGTRWEGPPRGDRDGGRTRWNRAVYGRDYAGPYFTGGGDAPGARGFGFRGGPGRPSTERGYDREAGGRAAGPFLPAEAYGRHPELERGGHEDEPWDDRAYEYYGRGSDEAVARAVRDRLYRDSWLEPDGLNVEVHDGVVTLTGEVADFMEARYAWDDAWETDGVRGVINNLTVRLEPSTHGDPMTQDGEMGEG
ncbi:MAG: hypothetical protein JWM27_2635 [Gemmatimonadetes bacterium]|nr:hypothetical protein [Gemmatimonadota bacterium]